MGKNDLIKYLTAQGDVQSWNILSHYVYVRKNIKVDPIEFKSHFDLCKVHHFEQRRDKNHILLKRYNHHLENAVKYLIEHYHISALFDQNKILIAYV